MSDCIPQKTAGVITYPCSYLSQNHVSEKTALVTYSLIMFASSWRLLSYAMEMFLPGGQGPLARVQVEQVVSMWDNILLDLSQLAVGKFPEWPWHCKAGLILGWAQPMRGRVTL